MDSGSEYQPSDAIGLSRDLAENTVEYQLFILDKDLDSRKTLPQLEHIRKEAHKLCREVAGTYIWQRDEFNLELVNEQGLYFLRGRTDYGDAVEDEWLITYLLRRLTISHPALWVRLFDSDGEFLLIEAANVLPKWLSPENDARRVWLHKGQLFLIPITAKDPAVTTPRSLSLPFAVEFITQHTSSLVHSSLVESEALYRLGKYPVHISESSHSSLLTIPRKLATLLHEHPKAVAPAVEAFYLRDALSLKPILSASTFLKFPPEDLVTTSVRFSKVLYAQLRAQRFDAPPKWNDLLQNPPKTFGSDPSDDTDTRRSRLELGMKLTIGFEILAPALSEHRARTIRELHLTLADLDEDGPNSLPTDDEISKWKDVKRSDPDTWLDINYQDFERELDGGLRSGQQRQPSTSNTASDRGDLSEGPNAGFGDATTQADLRKIVSRFESFFADESAGLDGAQLDEMDQDDDDDDGDNSLGSESEDEDREVSFDEEEFANMMREMMGFPPSKTSTSSTNKKDVGSGPGLSQAETQPEADKAVSGNGESTEEEEDEEGEAIRELASQFKAELTDHGALALDPPSSSQARLTQKAKPGTSKASAPGGQTTETEKMESGDEEEVDVDYNLAKNLLESFKSQGGMAGPTGNLLGMMGFQLPRDDDDDLNDVKNRGN